MIIAIEDQAIIYIMRKLEQPIISIRIEERPRLV
ncbi:hypothetical protein SOV_13050 [Sporomusa ovata DSM 2662]|nr:hypothetical protein SOV_1c06410 [Sporomusa ovata DSM 2662]